MTSVGWAVGVAVGDGSFAEGIGVGSAVSLDVAAGDEVVEERSPAATTEAHALRLTINATPITSRRT